MEITGSGRDLPVLPEGPNPEQHVALRTSHSCYRVVVRERETSRSVCARCLNAKKKESKRRRKFERKGIRKSEKERVQQGELQSGNLEHSKEDKETEELKKKP